MMFNEKIKKIREELQILKRKLDAVMDIDTTSFCKIDCSDRRARREQIPLIDEIQVDLGELLTLWITNPVTAVVEDDKKYLSYKVLDLAKRNIYKPTSTFITNQVTVDGEAIILIGTRISESQQRAKSKT